MTKEFVAKDESSVSELTCSVCLRLFVNPMEIVECGHLFCDQCVNLPMVRQCPMCRCTNMKLKKPNRAILRLLEMTQGYCGQCGWQGTYEQYTAHHSKTDCDLDPEAVVLAAAGAASSCSGGGAAASGPSVPLRESQSTSLYTYHTPVRAEPSVSGVEFVDSAPNSRRPSVGPTAGTNNAYSTSGGCTAAPLPPSSSTTATANQQQRTAVMAGATAGAAGATTSASAFGFPTTNAFPSAAAGGANGYTNTNHARTAAGGSYGSNAAAVPQPQPRVGGAYGPPAGYPVPQQQQPVTPYGQPQPPQQQQQQQQQRPPQPQQPPPQQYGGYPSQGGYPQQPPAQYGGYPQQQQQSSYAPPQQPAPYAPNNYNSAPPQPYQNNANGPSYGGGLMAAPSALYAQPSASGMYVDSRGRANTLQASNAVTSTGSHNVYFNPFSGQPMQNPHPL